MLKTNRIGMAVWLALILATTQAARAQDFHVSTTVYDLTRSQPHEVSSSLTLFHAGKAYDFVQGINELIVFEPSHDRFTLASTRQRRAAVVHVDEIKRMLQMARHTFAEHVDALKGSEKPNSKDLIEALVFQIDPRFQETFTAKNREGHLDMTSKHFQYHVQCAQPPVSEHADAYLQYADWICRLNYVLHPGALLPEQRLALNASLRKHGAIPIEVVLEGQAGGPIHLRAQHRLYWELTDRDRELLRQWDSLLAGKDIKRVSFEEYQRSVLVSQASRRR